MCDSSQAPKLSRVKMRALLYLVMLLLCGFLLAGCATVPLALPELDHAAKQFQPLPDQAQVYIVWPSRIPGAVVFQIFLDGRMLGGLATNTYFAVPLTPGPHTLLVVTMGTQDQLRLMAEAGQQYFVAVKSTAGLLYDGVNMEQLDTASGQEAVRKAVLAQGI
jgi:hypothetical protein